MLTIDRCISDKQAYTAVIMHELIIINMATSSIRNIQIKIDFPI